MIMFMFKHKLTMAVKTITITEEAYNALKRIKLDSESFSKIIINITNEKANPVEKYFGVMKGSKMMQDIREKVASDRKKFNEDYKKRIIKIKNGHYDSS